MTLRVACIGAGYFSRFHLESWARLDGVQMVGICDHDLARARETGLPAYGSLAQMLNDTSPDLLDVILPPAAQADALRTGCVAGIKTIICQKPFCADLAEAQALTDLAAQTGTTLIIHENFRFQPWYRAMRAVIDAGDLGDLHQMTFRLRPGDGQGPRAYLDRQPYFQQMPRFLVRETAVHWIDTFRFLLGDPDAVYADLRRINPVIEGEDAGIILSDHPSSGARALFDGNRHLDHPTDNHRRTMGEALLEGSRATLALTGDGAVHLRRHGHQTSTQILGPDPWDGFGGDCVHRLQRHVICGLWDGTALENTAADYLTVRRTEDAIYRSAKEGRKLALMV